MKKDEWLEVVSKLLGFSDGFPEELKQQAVVLYEEDLSIYQAERWFLDALKGKQNA